MIPKRRWPWVAQQNWEDILFIHKPIRYEKLRSFVPYPFEIDTYNNEAWISIVLFRATHSRLRFMPPQLSFPQFYQMNIRTYVRFGDECGVYFFNIHANNPFVHAGGSIAGMPFAKAHMTMKQQEGTFVFESSQLFNQPQSTFHVSYEPTSRDVNMHPDALPHFLSERYAIWMIQNNKIIKAPIFHTPWNLKQADTTVLESTHLPFLLTDDVVTHYADFKHTFIHPYEKIGIVSQK